MELITKQGAALSLPKGYKQTEVGLIPEDWIVSKIEDVSTLINGRGFKPYEWKKQGLPIIRIQNLNGSNEFNYYQGSFDDKILVKNSQLLFAWSGSKGTSFGPHIWQGGDGLLNYHTWKINCKENRIDKDFYYWVLKVLTAKIEGMARGASALVHTQKWEMEGFEIPLPPTLTEQKAIATALSDVDELISSLDQLITKKKAIKQGAMQELLTGKTRLQGFAGSGRFKQTEVGVIPEEWTYDNLGNLVSYTKGFAFKSADYRKDGIRIIRVSDTLFDKIINKTPVYVDENRKQEFRNWTLHADDLVLSTVGSKPPMYDSMVGNVVRVSPEHDGSLLNQNAVLLRIKSDIGFSQKFLYYSFKKDAYITIVRGEFKLEFCPNS